MSVLDEYERWQNNLRYLRPDDAKARCSAFLEWLDVQQSTQPILRSLMDIAPRLVEGCNMRNPPRAGSPEEVAAVGIHLMDQCRQGKELYEAAYTLGIRAGDGDATSRGTIDAAVDRFIEPAIDLMRQRLEDALQSSSPDHLAKDHLQQLVTSGFRASFPESQQWMDRIAGEFASGDEDRDWSTVGNSVRNMLKDFIAEVSRTRDLDIPDDLKAGDFKGIVNFLVSRMLPSERFSATLRALLSATWDHTQSLTHRPTTTRYEAERCFLLAAIAITELFVAIAEE